MLSQTTDITKLQKERIEAVFTPDKIIEISKGLSNEERQAKEIDSLYKIIDSKDKTIELLKEEYTETLIQIAKHNQLATDSSVTIDDISDNQLKEEKRKWKGLHLYAGIGVPKFQFDEIVFSAELMYELERFEFGFNGSMAPSIELDNNNYQFYYYLRFRYKIF